MTENIHLSDVTNKYYTVLYRTVVVYEKKNRSLVFSGSRKIPTLGSTVPWETRQASFPTGMVGPRVGIFLSPLNTNDGFYLSLTLVPAQGRDQNKQLHVGRTHAARLCVASLSCKNDVTMSNCSVLRTFLEVFFMHFQYKMRYLMVRRKRINNSGEEEIEKSVPRDHCL